MPVNSSNTFPEEDISKLPHLKHIKIPRNDASVDLLIGTNASRSMEPWEVINSRGEGPYAVKTLLGWVVNGPLHGNRTKQYKNGHNAVYVNHIEVNTLEQMLLNQYKHDFMENFSTEKEEISEEEKRFMNIMKNSVQLEDGHYKMNLPFKKENISMPDNFAIANQHMKLLKRRFQRDQNFHKEYTNFLSNMIAKAYAMKVP